VRTYAPRQQSQFGANAARAHGPLYTTQELALALSSVTPGLTMRELTCFIMKHADTVPAPSTLYTSQRGAVKYYPLHSFIRWYKETLCKSTAPTAGHKPSE
jgi:hypothetical protein